MKKLYLISLISAALAVTACSKQPEPAAEPAPEQPAATTEAPVAEATAEAAPTTAATASCETTISGDDAMKFDTATINVSKACPEYTIHLKHVGTKPKAMMGHNVVITSEADMQGVVADALVAGPDHDYLKADDSRVIVHTDLIGGGEETSVTFDPTKLADGSYKFFCTFPGHAGTMKGDVVLVD